MVSLQEQDTNNIERRNVSIEADNMVMMIDDGDVKSIYNFIQPSNMYRCIVRETPYKRLPVSNLKESLVHFDGSVDLECEHPACKEANCT